MSYFDPPEPKEISDSYMMQKWNAALGLEGMSAEGCPSCSEPVTNSGEGWRIICPDCGEIDLEEYFWETYWESLGCDYD